MCSCLQCHATSCAGGAQSVRAEGLQCSVAQKHAIPPCGGGRVSGLKSFNIRRMLVRVVSSHILLVPQVLQGLGHTNGRLGGEQHPAAQPFTPVMGNSSRFRTSIALAGKIQRKLHTSVLVLWVF